jgi:biopolymer transport protein ExbD
MIKRTKFDTINVIPLVDITLVLLVIVLSTSTFLNSSLKLELPSSTANTKPITKDTITITITKDNIVYFNNQKITKQQLKKKIQSYSLQQAYVIKGDRRSNFEEFITIIDIFKQLNIKNVSILTSGV